MSALFPNHESRVTNNQCKRDAFTLIELLVVVAIVALLAALLLPALKRARENARLTGCTSNLHQLYLANLSYAQDYHGQVVPLWDFTSPMAAWSVADWPFKLMPYLGYRGDPSGYWWDDYNHGSLEIRTTVEITPGVSRTFGYKTAQDTTTRSPNPFLCPATRGAVTWPNPGIYSGVPGYIDAYCDYGPNGWLSGMIDEMGQYYSYPIPPQMGGSIKTDPAKLLFIGDANGYRPCISSSYSYGNRHFDSGNDGVVGNAHASGRMNCAFFDGHVENFNFTWDPPNHVNPFYAEKDDPGWRFYLRP